MPRYPKPDGERVNHHALAFDWVALPAEGRDGPVPELPERTPEWAESTREWWARLWATPQATQWAEDDPEIARLALLHQTVWHESPKGPSPGLLNEMRQIEDRHGLNPKAMLQLRWRVVAQAGAEESKPKAAKGRRGLELVESAG